MRRTRGAPSGAQPPLALAAGDDIHHPERRHRPPGADFQHGRGSAARPDPGGAAPWPPRQGLRPWNPPGSGGREGHTSIGGWTSIVQALPFPRPELEGILRGEPLSGGPGGSAPWVKPRSSAPANGQALAAGSAWAVQLASPPGTPPGQEMTLARPGEGWGALLPVSASVRPTGQPGRLVLAGAGGGGAEGEAARGDRPWRRRARRRAVRGEAASSDAGARRDAPGAEEIVHARCAGDHAAVFVQRHEAGGGRQGAAGGATGRAARWRRWPCRSCGGRNWARCRSGPPRSGRRRPHSPRWRTVRALAPA